MRKDEIGHAKAETTEAQATATGGYIGAAPQRAESLFKSIGEWTPGQFRNAVELNEVLNVRDPDGNTLLHRAIETDNLPVAELIVQEYGIKADVRNGAGVSCGELAIAKGVEFAGIFGDMKAEDAASTV